MRSNAATVIGHGLKGSATVSGGFEASTSNTWGRSAIEQYYGDIKFYADAASATTYGAAYTPTERMRITSAGNVGVGTTAPKGKINSVLSQADTSSSSDTTLASSFLHMGGGEYGNGRYFLTTYGYSNGATNSGAYVGAVGTSNTGFGAYDLVFGTRSVTTDTAPTERLRIKTNGEVHSKVQYTGGFGAKFTGGSQDWNAVSNARSGNGETLLIGSATNGPGTSAYFHIFNYEYSSKDGSGNMAQMAIPYYSSTYYHRNKYQGNWTSWTTV